MVTGRRCGFIILTAIIIAIIIILIGYFCKNKNTLTNNNYLNKATPIVSTIDGKEYKVHQNLDNPQSAANILAIINETIIKLLTYLKYKYNASFNRQPLVSNAGLDLFSNTNINQHPLSSRVTAVHKILSRYNPDNLIENSPLDTKGDTSYTMDKGSIIAFCLRDKNETHSLHNLPMLLFVAIHELAHVAIDDNDHPPVFWETFKWLLLEAEEAGIYQSPNFANTPYDYCGMNVDYNPRFDNSVNGI